MGSASSEKKKQTKINCREVAPGNGGSQTLKKEHEGVMTTYQWCAKCQRGQGLWTSTHTTATHTRQRPTATTDATPATASTLMELSEGGFYCN